MQDRTTSPIRAVRPGAWVDERNTGHGCHASPSRVFPPDIGIKCTLSPLHMFLGHIKHEPSVISSSTLRTGQLLRRARATGKGMPMERSSSRFETTANSRGRLCRFISDWKCGVPAILGFLKTWDALEHMWPSAGHTQSFGGTSSHSTEHLRIHCNFRRACPAFPFPFSPPSSPLPLLFQSSAGSASSSLVRPHPRQNHLSLPVGVRYSHRLRDPERSIQFNELTPPEKIKKQRKRP